MRITKEPPMNTNIISTLRNLNKINPSPNIDLTNIHRREIVEDNSSNPIKVKLINNNNTQLSTQKKLPIDFLYNDTKNNLNQKEINNLRRSLIFTQEKQNNINKESEFMKKVSMSPKLTLRYEDNDNISEINNGKNINNKIKETPTKKYNMISILSKNFLYNKKKANNPLSNQNKKKDQSSSNTKNNNMNNKYINDDNISVASFNSLMTDINTYKNVGINNNQINQNKKTKSNQNINIKQSNYEYNNNIINDKSLL